MSTPQPDDLAKRGKNAAMLIPILSPLIGWPLTAYYLRRIRGHRKHSEVLGRALATTAVWVIFVGALYRL